jgi:circadian clock protein KaiC
MVPSGLPELDRLLGGGPERGSSMLIVGPAGTGKSALAVQYVVSAAERGEHAAIFAFDEGKRTLETRAAGLGMDVRPYLERKLVSIQQVDPAELAPGEFVDSVRRAVEQDGVRVLVIDSLNGYLHAMPQEQFLLVHMHELLSYLRQRGVLTLLVVAQHGFLGNMTAPVDLSYLADVVLLTRYFEASGHVRKSISVVKKRTGAHETTIRELALAPGGIQVGPALSHFHGVLTGNPVYEGEEDHRLLDGPSG